MNVTEKKHLKRGKLKANNNDHAEEAYDPFNLFEYDNRAIAIQTLQRINDNLNNSLNNLSSNTTTPTTTQSVISNNNTTSNSLLSSSSNNRRRASISSSTPSSTPRSNSTTHQQRKNDPQYHWKRQQSSLPSSPLKRNNSVQSEQPSKISTPRPVFNRSNSDSQSLGSSSSARQSKRRVSITGWVQDNQHQSNCICSNCGHEMIKQEEKKKPLITPSTEIFKALTEIEYDQALKQSMKGMEKVNLNDEEQLDLVAEILSETLLKNDGLSLSKRKQKPKKSTHFSQTETYFENRTDNRPFQPTLEKQFDFTNKLDSPKKTIQQSNNTTVQNKSNITQTIRNIEMEKNSSPLIDEECKLISEPFITIQNNRMNFYPNEPSKVIVSSRRQNPIKTVEHVNANSRKYSNEQLESTIQYPTNSYPTGTYPATSSSTTQMIESFKQPIEIVQSTSNITTPYIEHENTNNEIYRDQCMNTDDMLNYLNEEARNELYESAKRKGQDEIISMYINSKLKERRKKHSKVSDKKTSLSFLFPGLYKKIQTDLKLKRLESTDPYNKPMNHIIQEMKSLVERC